MSPSQITFQGQELSFSVFPSACLGPSFLPSQFLGIYSEGTLHPPTYHYNVCTAVLDPFTFPYGLISHLHFCLELN